MRRKPDHCLLFLTASILAGFAQTMDHGHHRGLMLIKCIGTPKAE